MSRISHSQLVAIVFVCCLVASGQTPKNFTKDGLSFDYPDGWTLTDDTNADAQQFTLTKAEQRRADQSVCSQGPYLAGEIAGREEGVYRSLHRGDSETVRADGSEAGAVA